ncbi:MAG: YwaF family protein [Coprobacillus sp.]|nr:YwaF family protein [Coprobacillus sp.]
MIYLICAGSVLVFGIILLILKVRKVNHSALKWVLRGAAILLLALFFIRYYASSSSIFSSIYKAQLSEEDPEFSSRWLMILTFVALWLEIMSVLCCELYPFFTRFKVLANYAKTIGLISSVLNIALIQYTAYSYVGDYSLNLCSITLAVEVGLVFIMCLYPLCEKGGLKITSREIVDMLSVFLIVLIMSMPPYAFEFMFGKVGLNRIAGFDTYHRFYLYIFVGIFAIFTLLLQNRDKDFIRMMLLYMTMGALVMYASSHTFDIFTHPYQYPLHLCNLGLILILICLVVHCKWLFWFTLFVNVVGAFGAMMIPGFDTGLYAFSDDIVIFWYTHIIAFTVPMLMALLGVYERPRFKQFSISIGLFAIYFVAICAIDAVLVNYHSTTDFFFVVGDSITSVLGDWAVNLKADYTLSFNAGELTLTFYWAYQLIFFGVYLVMMLIMYFVITGFLQLRGSFESASQINHKIRVEEYVMKKKHHTRRLSEIMNEESKDKLVVKNLYKAYGRSNIYAVEDASFTVNSGEIVGFLGHNGAGKSTIIKSIVGIHPATSGTIEVNGYDVDKQPVEAKLQIGFVPDHYALYERLTGRQYINYVADLYGVSEEDREVRLKDLTESLSMVEAIDSKISTYSHGMKQKTAIMAALIHEPKVWILDEPLTGLDPVSVYEVKECMRKHAAKGNIVFFSSHLIDVVEKLCDRIIVIKEGHILLNTPLSNIEARYDDLEKFYLDMNDIDVHRSLVRPEKKAPKGMSYFYKSRKRKANKTPTQAELMYKENKFDTINIEEGSHYVNPSEKPLTREEILTQLIEELKKENEAAQLAREEKEAEEKQRAARYAQYGIGVYPDGFYIDED